jgi:mono/diheme cytochrome c family protein
MRLSTAMIASAFGLALLAGSAAAATEDGAALYKSKCSLCHGKDGEPKPSFAKKGVQNHKDPEWQKSMTDEAIRKAIVEGSKGTLMRSYEKELSAEQIEALIAHIRSLAPKP